MKLKSASEMVWAVENYTDKLHFAVKFTFQNNPHLPFTRDQIIQSIQRGYSWLTLDNNQRIITLSRIVKTAITKLIQRGIIAQVVSKTSVDPQWIMVKGITEAYKNVTSWDLVAHTEAAEKATRRRAISPITLWKLNHIKTSTATA